MEISLKTQKITQYFYRLLALSISFIAGWMLYIIGIVFFPYEGFVAILLQVVLGAFITGTVVLFSWLAGLIIRKYVSKTYLPRYHIHLCIVVTSLLIIIFGYSFGLRSSYINPEIGTAFQSGNMTSIIVSYLLIIFFIANWPTKQFEGSFSKKIVKLR